MSDDRPLLTGKDVEANMIAQRHPWLLTAQLVLGRIVVRARDPKVRTDALAALRFSQGRLPFAEDHHTVTQDRAMAVLAAALDLADHAGVTRADIVALVNRETMGTRTPMGRREAVDFLAMNLVTLIAGEPN